MKKKFLAVLLLAVLLAMSMAQAAWAAEPANTELYGIIVDGKSSNSWDWSASDNRVKLFTQSEELIEYGYASDFNGDKLQSTNLGLLVKYVLNSQGEILTLELINPANSDNALEFDFDKEIEIKNNLYLVAGDKSFVLDDDVIIFEVGQDDTDISPWRVSKSELLRRGDFMPEMLIGVGAVVGGAWTNNFRIPAYAVYQTNEAGAIKVLAYTEASFAKYNYGIVQDFQQEDNTVTLLGDDKVYEWDITSARVKKGSVVVYTRGGENMLRAVYSFDKYGALTGYTKKVVGYTDGLISVEGGWTAVEYGLQPGQIESRVTEQIGKTVSNVLTNEYTIVYGLNTKTGAYEECSLKDIAKDAMIFVPVIDKDGYAECVLIDKYTPENPVDPKPEVVAVTGVTLNQQTAALKMAETLTLQATVAPENATNKAVTWTTSDAKVATVSNGQVKAVGAGTATITVTTADGGKTAACTVTVTQPAIGVTLNYSEISLLTGGTAQLQATVSEGASNKNVTWTSNNTTVATVDETGKVTAVSAGEAVITATAADGSGQKAECKVTVTGTAVPGEAIYTITFDTDGGTMAGPSFMQVTKETKVTMPTAEKSGYNFKYWQDVANSSQTYAANNVYSFAADTELKAIWERRSSGGSSGGGGSRPATKPGTTTETKPSTESNKPGNSGSKEITAANIGTVFGDVQNNAWYSEAIAYVYNKGMMNGTEKGFEPNSATTRAMIVTMLHRLNGTPATGVAGFADVAGGQWYSEAVAWAAANGVVNGYSDTKFAPNEEITREQLAAILYRYAQFKGLDVSAKGDLSGFADGAAVSGWAQEAMQWAVGAGLLNGNADGTLAPAAGATRAEMAMILMRFEGAVK